MGRRISRYLALLLVITSFITGCSGARETDEIAYSVAIGLDASDDPDKVNVTYQIAVPRGLGQNGGGGKPGETSVALTIKAHNLATARDLFGVVSARRPNLSHTKIYVVGEELARKGLTSVFGPIMRFREFRGSMYLVVVNNGTAAEFINKNRSRLESLPSRYYESMMLSYQEGAYFLPSNIHYFYTSLKSNSGSPYAALVGINPNTGEDQPTGHKHPAFRADAYLAGDVPRKQQPETGVEFAGTALFNKEGKMVAKLSTIETRMLSILMGLPVSGYLVFTDPLKPKEKINIEFRPGEKPKTTVKIIDGRAHITIDVLVEGQITSISSGIQNEKRELMDQLEKYVSQVLEDECRQLLSRTQAIGVDPVGFGFHARPQFRTYQEFKAVDWERLYKEAEITVKVKTRIRRTGLMLKTTSD